MTDETTISTEVIGFAPLGEVFANARNAKNLALKDVSNNLRLSIKQIEALESDDFAHLPPAMITRGFIRNYARLLELDADPLLSSYRARVPEVLPTALSVQTSMNQVMPGNSHSSLLKYFVIVGLIGLSLAAGFYYTNHIQKPVSVVNESPTQALDNHPTSELAVLPEVALPVAERQPADAASTEFSTSGSATDAVEAGNKPEQAPAVAVNSPATVVAPVQPPKEAAMDFKTLKEKATAKQLTANMPEVKVASTEVASSGLKTESAIAAIKSANIAVSEQTWVRVTDKTGAVVYEKMLQPNSQDGFNGLPPFKVLIGNAKGTKLTFLGQEVDLTDKTRNNVARVTLE